MTKAPKDEIARLIGERVAWLDSERRNGGNFQHLTARIEEAQYLAGKIAALAPGGLREALGKLLAVVDKQSDALNSDSLSDDEIWEWAGARENARAALKSTNGEPNAN